MAMKAWIYFYVRGFSGIATDVGTQRRRFDSWPLNQRSVCNGKRDTSIPHRVCNCVVVKQNLIADVQYKCVFIAYLHCTYQTFHRSQGYFQDRLHVANMTQFKNKKK